MAKLAIIGSRGFPSYYGGFETLVRELAPYLASQGHEVVVYGREPGGSEQKVRVGDTDNVVTVRSTRGIESKSLSTLTFGYSAVRDLCRRQCDAVLVLNVANGLFLRRLRRAGVPICVNVDGLEWERGKWGPVAKRVFLAGAKGVAKFGGALIMDSQALIPVWQSEFGCVGVYIPYGATPVKYSGCSRLAARGLPKAGYILAVARIVPENNVALMLDALAFLGERYPVIVVGDGEAREPTVIRLRQLDGVGRIRWLGRVNDQALLNELWSNAGVYWHGHSVGGTNPALLQAMASGAPCVALDTPFNREVLDHPTQLVSADPVLVAASLERVLCSPGRASEMRERQSDTVQKRFGWDNVCASYEKVLLRMVKG